MSTTVRQRGLWSVPLASLNGLDTPWEVVTDLWQPTTMTPTDKGIVFSSDQPEGGVFVISRADPLRRYRRVWAWQGSALPGFGYKAVRDPDTGIVYAGWVAYPGFKPIITASDGVSGSLVWEADEPATETVNGVRDLNIMDGWLIGTLVDNGAWSVLRTPIPPLAPRLSSDDDPGRVLGGLAVGNANNRPVAVGFGSRASGKAQGSTAVGYEAQALADGTIAIGGRAIAPVNGATVIGDGATVSGTTSTAAVVVGQSAQVSGPLSVAVGYLSATASNGVSIGTYATSGNNSVVVGQGANIIAGKSASVAVGRLASGATRTVVVGAESSATADYSSVLGSNSTAAGGYATTLGASSSAGHSGSVALGASVTTTATNQVAIGNRDLELQGNGRGVFLRSANGTRHKITVSDAGALVVVVAA